MAEFQHMDDTKVTPPITTVKGSTIHLKLIPGAKEALPTISAAPATIAKVINIKERKQANFTTFEIEAVTVGKASLTATDAKKANVATPIDVIVEDKVTLPDSKTNEGLLARLFIAEVPSPEESGYTLEDAKTSMIWMRVVVENRLKTPSSTWGSAGATTMQDVIRAQNQFEGFSGYPTLINRIQSMIDDTVSIANNGDDTRRSKYKAFVDAALEIANQKAVTDPSTKGLFWWRTAGSGSPTSDAVLYMTKLKNTFYTRK